jgi:hypothetical protein
VARKTAEALRNPPETLYITSWPKTPIRYWIDGSVNVVVSVVSGRVINLKSGQLEYRFVVFYPIVQDAPDKVLLHIMAHEFAHVVGYEEEAPVNEMIDVLAMEFPEDFANVQEYDEYILSVASKLSPDEVEDLRKHEALLKDPERVEMVFNELMKYARPVKPMAVAPPPAPLKGLGPEELRILREEFEKILPNPTPEELKEFESLLGDLQRSLADYDRETAMRVALEDVRHVAKRLLEERLAAPPAPSGVCPICGKPVIKGVDEWTEYKGQLYHWPCFEKVRPKLLGWE